MYTVSKHIIISNADCRLLLRYKNVENSIEIDQSNE